jgi:beta-N-acetylhexosaminidase
MSDDLSMDALSGAVGDRTRAALAAGCDMVLHCNGKLPEMREVAANAPLLAGEAAHRAEIALAARKPPQPFDLATPLDGFFKLIAGVWPPQESA